MSKHIAYLEEELAKHKYYLRSAYRKCGRVFQQFAPFTKEFPGPKDRFVFIGQPIDGIIFGDDLITFVEIKTGDAELSESQKRIRTQIEQGKVNFREVRYRHSSW